MKLFKFLFTPPALKLARQELAMAQRELLVAESNAEFAVSVSTANLATATYNRQRIIRLEGRIQELSALKPLV